LTFQNSNDRISSIGCFVKVIEEATMPLLTFQVFTELIRHYFFRQASAKTTR